MTCFDPYIFLTCNELNINFSKHQNFKIKVLKFLNKKSNIELIFCGDTLYDVINKYVKNHSKVYALKNFIRTKHDTFL